LFRRKNTGFRIKTPKEKAVAEGPPLPGPLLQKNLEEREIYELLNNGEMRTGG
jgi:hypothetical protein